MNIEYICFSFSFAVIKKEIQIKSEVIELRRMGQNLPTPGFAALDITFFFNIFKWLGAKK